MEPLTWILGGISLAFISGIAGKVISNGGKMSETHCKEKQESCQSLVITKIDNLGTKVDALTEVVNKHH